MPVELSSILNVIDRAVSRFDKTIPTLQSGALEELYGELRGLDLRGKTVVNSVKNIRLIARIKSKLLGIMLNDDYVGALKEYMGVFDEVTKLQNDYFKSQEVSKSAYKLGNELRKQTIQDTVGKLTESGIGTNIADKIQDILRTNITTGSSYKSLTDQLNEALTNTTTNGLLQRYTRQITTDAVNQYSAQYMSNITNDLGYEWYRYQGKDIDTTRPFCDAMTDRGYFHISELPALLKAHNLTYKDKDGQEKPVEIYPRTGLPNGMIEGTDASNFFVRRGGYNCGHQIFPVAKSRVPLDVRDRLENSSAYASWSGKKTTTEAEDTVTKSRGKFGSAASSDMVFKNKNGEYLEDRKSLHDKLIAGALGDAIPSKNPIISMIGGATANGKSTYLNSGKASLPENAISIDPDLFKTMLPEYKHLLSKKDFKAAAYAHEESSHLLKRTVSEAMAKKINISVDSIFGGKYEDLAGKVNAYKTAGYRTKIDYVTLDTELSLKLAKSRGEKTGRFVPEEITIAKNAEIAINMPRILKDKLFDELNLWDTNENGNPRLILSLKDGKVTMHNQSLYDRFLKKAKK